MARKPVDAKLADDAQQSSSAASRSPRRRAPSPSTHRGESATESSFCVSYFPQNATRGSGNTQRPIPARSDLANGLVQHPSNPHSHRLQKPRRSNSPFSRLHRAGRLRRVCAPHTVSYVV
jgi:hypothetical protein